MERDVKDYVDFIYVIFVEISVKNVININEFFIEIS